MCDTSRASPAPPLAPPQPPPAELPSREDDASGLRASPRRYKFALPEIHTAISTLSRRSGTFAPTHSEYRPVHRPASDLLHAKPGRLRDVLAAAPQQLPEASSNDPCLPYRPAPQSRARQNRDPLREGAGIQARGVRTRIEASQPAWR